MSNMLRYKSYNHLSSGSIIIAVQFNVVMVLQNSGSEIVASIFVIEKALGSLFTVFFSAMLSGFSPIRRMTSSFVKKFV